MNKAERPNKKKCFGIKWYNNISIISDFLCLAFTFPVSDIFKGICLQQAYIPSLDSHCLSLITTVSFSPLATTFLLRDFQYSIKSGDTFVYWVSSKSAFLTLYISQLSFPLRSTSLSPFAILYFLLTNDACLSISIHCARHAERKMSLSKSCAATTQVI